MCYKSNGNPDVLAIKDYIASTPARAARFIAWIFQANRGDLWGALVELDQLFTAKLLRYALSKRAAPVTTEDPVVSFWNDGVLIVLRTTGIEILRPSDPIFSTFLPYPGDEWIVLGGPVKLKSGRNLEEYILQILHPEQVGYTFARKPLKPSKDPW